MAKSYPEIEIIKRKFMAEPTTYSNTPVVQRRGGNAWGWIIPVLLILLVLGVYLYYHNKNKTATTTANTYSNTSNQTTSGSSVTTVTNIADLVNAAAGTNARLASVPVAKVVSSRIFTIKSGTQTLYAVLEPNVNLPSGATLKAGENLGITGVLASTTGNMYSNLSLTAAEKTSLANQPLVLVVDQVTAVGTSNY